MATTLTQSAQRFAQRTPSSLTFNLLNSKISLKTFATFALYFAAFAFRFRMVRRKKFYSRRIPLLADFLLQKHKELYTIENIKSISLKSKKAVINDLNEIHQLINHSKEGYHSASEATDNPELKVLFSKLSGERIVFAAELSEHIAMHDEEAGNENGGILQGLHHIWLNIKQVLSKKDDKALLIAISAGERAAMEKYDECIASYADHADHMTLLTEQREGVQAAVDAIETLIVKENN